MSRQPEDRRDPVDASVGARVRLARKMRGQSQQALAVAIGVTFQQVQKYERGANRISASMLVRIAAALGVSVAELFGPAEAASRVSDNIAAMIGEPGALKLLQDYCRLPPGYRAALASFVAALSDPQGGGP
jgi:transcriptional regulator with XRE-family HTH domain